MTAAPGVVALTGAAGGIGLATARRFASAGWSLALADRTIDGPLEALAEQAPHAIVVRTDVALREEATQFIAEAETAFGRIDVVVTCAGILRSSPSHAVPPEQWLETVATNLSGTWWCISAALPGMVERRRGRIVTVSSELGLIGYPGYAAYAASKGGVVALTKALAKELAALGILVNSVAPGPVETRMLVEDSVEYNDETREQVPLGRFGQPDEIARVIEFLAGPGGDFMVGQIVSPNGGTAI